jgi:hypothetical protein
MTEAINCTHPLCFIVRSGTNLALSFYIKFLRHLNRECKFHHRTGDEGPEGGGGSISTGCVWNIGGFRYAITWVGSVARTWHLCRLHTLNVIFGMVLYSLLQSGTSHKTWLRGFGGNGSIAWTFAVSHVGRTSNAFKVTMKLQTFLFQMVVISCISVQYLWKYCFAKSSDSLYAPCVIGVLFL